MQQRVKHLLGSEYFLYLLYLHFMLLFPHNMHVNKR